MAKALGWPAKKVGWRTLATLAAAAHTAGEPSDILEWGTSVSASRIPCTPRAGCSRRSPSRVSTIRRARVRWSRRSCSTAMLRGRFSTTGSGSIGSARRSSWSVHGRHRRARARRVQRRQPERRDPHEQGSQASAHAAGVDRPLRWRVRQRLPDDRARRTMGHGSCAQGRRRVRRVTRTPEAAPQITAAGLRPASANPQHTNSERGDGRSRLSGCVVRIAEVAGSPQAVACAAALRRLRLHGRPERSPRSQQSEQDDRRQAGAVAASPSSVPTTRSACGSSRPTCTTARAPTGPTSCRSGASRGNDRALQQRHLALSPRSGSPLSPRRTTRSTR